jgi:2-polyprenyl-6-methoxyphenol hydroxylase-like FAD-dependent oxidoreductase
MEIMRGLGVADEVASRGLTRVDLCIHAGNSVIRGRLGDLHLPTTEYPFILFAPQPAVEAVLAERLASMGVGVEWGSELVGFEQSDDEVRCRVSAGRETRLVTRYLAGCDGADSTVRRLAGIRFRGHSYKESILIADAGPTPDLEPGVAHAFLGARGILFFFPLPAGGWRLIGPSHPTVTASEIGTLVDRHTGGAVGLSGVDWARVITPQHRIAGSYRRGHVFLVGDAAHVHSPAGAQGMNTGIQDAANLGWKLGLVLRGGPVSLLDTYEDERRPVARQVVRLTGLAYALEVSEFAPLRWGRRWAARPIAGMLLPRPQLLSVIARLVSGLDTRYRRGALDLDRFSCSRYEPGRRLPDFEIADADHLRLHQLIEAGAFSLIVTGQADRLERNQVAHHYPDLVTIHELSPAAAKHLGAVTWVLVRPDGYIASSGKTSELAKAHEFLDRWVGDQLPAARSTL